jgi:hypothetical protein
LTVFPSEEQFEAEALGLAPPTDEVREIHELTVSVAHGNLIHADHPVIVGHYDGDLIWGAEGVLDRRLDGRLSERHRLYLYPGKIGEAEVMLRPERRPGGALVIGLGDVGGLTAQKLTGGVTNAALRYALLSQECLGKDADAGEPAPVGVSSVLIGTTKGQSLNVRSSVAAIVRGVLRANRVLRKQPPGTEGAGPRKAIQIDSVQFIERYWDRVTDALFAVRGLNQMLSAELESDEVIKPELDYKNLPGRCGVPLWDDAQSSWWRRIQISERKRENQDTDSIGSLEFLELTDRARAKVTSEPLSLQSVEKLVRATVNSSRYDPEIAVALFEHLLPREMKEGIQESSDLVLVVDSKAARYPWEMLAQRTRDALEPIANRLGIVRQLKTRRFRHEVIAAHGRDVLVVGDPQSPYVELPGAQEEARIVADKLGGDPRFDVKLCLREEGIAIECALFAREYRILHVAAHGHYDPASPARSGVVLGEDHFLNSITVDKLGTIPELVFLNCCHLAKTDVETKRIRLAPEHFVDFAASVSEKLIEIGVRCVVAAGWAVDDDAAATFAETFYDRLLAGDPFGEAVRTARRETYRRYQDRGINTWGAYQCYGDPGYVLDQRKKKSSRTRQTQWEVVNELEEIVSEAEAADERSQKHLHERLQAIAQSPRQFDGNAYALLGKGFGELKVWAPAVRYCRLALQSFEATAPLRIIEQLANFEVRLADELEQPAAQPDQGEPGEFQPDELRAAAERRLLLLVDLAETPERLSLLGSHYKRMAKLPQSASERKQALKSAEDYYGRAAALHRKATGRTDYYPAVHGVLFGVLFRLLQGGRINPEIKKTWRQTLDDSAAAAAAKYAHEPDFWNRVAQADIALVRALIDGKLHQQQTSVRGDYRQAMRDMGTAREHSSVTEHLDFVSSILSQKASEAKTVAAIQSIRAALARR